MALRYSLILLFALAAVGCNRGTRSDADSDRPTYAFVTNQIASFWNIAAVGVEDDGKDLDVDVVVKMPADATAVEQKRICEDLLASGIDGLAISPIDADNQTELLNEWAAQIPLITQDSDAPESNRRMYIGADNYIAGRMCGELVKQALPDGGKVILTIGRLEQDNAKLILSDEPHALVREIGVNTYRKYDDYPVEAADNYWAATGDFRNSVQRHRTIGVAKSRRTMSPGGNRRVQDRGPE